MQIDRINSALKMQNLEENTRKINRETGFGDILSQTLQDVNKLQLESTEAKKRMVLGEVDNLHDVSILAEKADVALQVTMAIRGKVVEAYKEILRMQV